jgi:hypothetical protein
VEPLFGSTEPQILPPELCWFVPPSREWVGQSLLLAGRPITLLTHRVGRRTWPCLQQWPKLGMECPHCERSRRSTTWVPVVSCSVPHHKLVLMGGQKTWESVKGLELRSFVECHFARVIRPTLVFTKTKLPIGLALMKSVAERLAVGGGDITRWLLHYWQWSKLTTRFSQTYRESLKVRATRERSDSVGMGEFARLA